jgi:hypothetical protein
MDKDLGYPFPQAIFPGRNIIRVLASVGSVTGGVKLRTIAV